jgi:hypothetical protein
MPNTDTNTPESPTPPDKPDKPSTPSTSNEYSDLFGPSDSEIQAELHKYAKALREEFERSPDPADRAAENVEKYTRDFFKKHIASAAAQIVWLSANSTSDSVRLRACQIIVKEALEDARADGDSVKDLLKDLMETPTT